MPNAVAFIPFRKSFEDAIRAGRKTATSRNHKAGEVGDILETDFRGIQVRLTEVYTATLGHIKRHLWREEGCANAEHFESVWRTLHRGHWHSDKPVWVHRFEVVSDAD